MRLERIADDGAMVAGHQVLEGRRSFVVSNLVDDDARPGTAPHLPFRTRLVKTDDRLGGKSAFCAGADSSSRRRRFGTNCTYWDDASRKRLALCLRVLARQRDVIEVLVDDDLDRGVRRVASVRNGALGARRGPHAAATFARVFLLFT